MAKLIERGMKVTIVIQDDISGCKIDIKTDPEINLNNLTHQESDSLMLLVQFLEIVNEQVRIGFINVIRAIFRNSC